MLLAYYSSKKELKECIGETLLYTETSIFGAEFRYNGDFFCSNRPAITGVKGREFFAQVTMKNGVIASVK